MIFCESKSTECCGEQEGASVFKKKQMSFQQSLETSKSPVGCIWKPETCSGPANRRRHQTTCHLAESWSVVRHTTVQPMSRDDDRRPTPTDARLADTALQCRGVVACRPILEMGKNPNPPRTNRTKTQVLPRTEPNPNLLFKSTQNNSVCCN